MSNLPTNLDLIAQNQGQKEATANAMFTAASPAMIYGRREQTSAGLVWGYYGGVLKTGSGYLTLANGAITLTDNADNYVEARLDTGAVVLGSGAFTSGRLALYKVTVASGVATAWTDYRQALLGAEGDGALAFTDLTDTPADYTGQEGKIAAVKADGTGLEFIDAPTGGVDQFTELSDTPADYTGQSGKVVKVKTDETGLEFADDAGGVTEFTQLTDAPSSFTGQAGKIPAVNSGETALEFVDLPAPGAEAFTELSDVPSSFTGQAGKIPAVNSGETALEFVDLPAPGADQFTELTDAPASFTGQAGKLVAVNSGETALEFVVAPSGSGFERALDDLNSFPGDLILSLRGGRIALADGSTVEFLGGNFSLSDDATNYFEVNPATGSVDFYTSGFTPGSTPVWEVVCASGAITSKTDLRPTYYAYQGQGGSGGAADFTDLGDVPSSYTGQAGKVPAVNSGETALEFVDLPAPGADAFTELSDAPSSFTGQAGKIPAVNSGETALEFIDPPTGGVDQFTELTDAPASFTGQGGKVVAVKTDETGLEFITGGGGGGAANFTDLGDVPAAYTGAGSYKVVVKSDATGLEFVPDSTGSDVDWVKISSDYTTGTAATAGADQSMAIGPGAETVMPSGITETISSTGYYGGGSTEGYVQFDTGPQPFTVGQTVTLSGFPAAGPETYGNFGLNDPGDQATVIMDTQNNFQIGAICTVADAFNPAINGDYTITGRPTTQQITLGDGFSATDSDLSGATFTSTVPTANGSYEITSAFYNQINFADFMFYFFPAPSGAEVSVAAEGKALALGAGSSATADRAVALGNDTVADRANTVMVGGRRIGGLADPANNDEAVTLQYYQNNQRFSEEQQALAGTLTSTPTDLQYNLLMYVQSESAGFLDGKIVVMTVADAKVSTWNYSCKYFVDNTGAVTVSAWTLTPVSVETEHADCSFEIVADPGGGANYWKFVVSNTGAGTAKYTILTRRTVAYNF